MKIKKRFCVSASTRAILFCIYFACPEFNNPTNALVVLTPKQIAGRHIESTTITRFTGPQNFTAVTGPVIVIEQPSCNSDATAPDYSGFVVVTKPDWIVRSCSIYERILATNALAWIDVSLFTVPGIYYNFVYYHDTSDKQMPAVQVAIYDFEPVLDMLEGQQNRTKEGGKANKVSIRVELDDNQWANMYDYWPYHFVFRVVLGPLFVCTGLFSLYILRQRMKTDHKRGKGLLFILPKLNATDVALGIEVFAMTVIGLNLIIGGMNATSNVSWPITAMLYTALSGFSLATTAAIGVVWGYQLQKTNFTSDANSDNIFIKYRASIIACSFFFIAFDTCGGILVALHFNIYWMANIIGGFLTSAQCLTALYFVKLERRMQKLLEGVNQDVIIKNRSIQRLLRMVKWIKISVFFMAMYTLLSIFFVTKYFFIPHGYFAFYASLFCFRWGISWSQIMAFHYHRKSYGIPPSAVAPINASISASSDSDSDGSLSLICHK